MDASRVRASNRVSPLPACMLAIVGVLGSFTLSAQMHGTAAQSVAGSAAYIDACALLLPSEISQVIDLPVDAGVRRDAGFAPNGSYSSACVWTIDPQRVVPIDPAAPLEGKSFVILNAMQWPAGSGLARTFLERFRAAALNGEIPGKTSPRVFGDEALWWGDGLAVRRRDVSFGISVFIPGSQSKHPGAFEEQLAPHILRRLEHSDERVRPAR